MSTLFEDLAAVDRRVHEPTSLAILTALSKFESAEFRLIQSLLGLTSGNLSSHLGRLEEAGFVDIAKQIKDKKSNTRIRLSKKGRSSVEQYWVAFKAAERKLRTLDITDLRLAPAK
jgi:DNA-binding transcriptional ArsR family regulator